MRRRFCGGTSHISDMSENGIWVITLYEGIIKGDRYDNRFITPGMICVKDATGLSVRHISRIINHTKAVDVR